MKKRIKLVALLMTFLFAFSFVACNNSGTGENSNSSEERIPNVIEIVPGGLGEGEAEQATTSIRHLRAKEEKAGRVTLEKNSDIPADFVLNVEGEGEIRILQITDTQMIDPTQVRLGNGAVSGYTDRDYVMYNLLRYVVEEAKPDLILITGDYVYGDYDDNGSLFREQTDFFDSLGIYWAVLFGNHDNDSDSTYARWLEDGWDDWYARKQCQYLENSKYCLFRTRTDLSGYSNFSIAVKQNGELLRSIYMLDTHGAKQTAQEIKQIQIDWYTQSVAEINSYAGKEIPSFVGIHVPIFAFNLAAQRYGYVYGTTPDIEIPENNNGDWGFLKQNPGTMDKDMKAFNAFKAGGTDAIMAGHLHKNNASILYDGIRLVFGTKSSRYDKYDESILGATLFTVNGSEFVTSPIYYTGN